MYKAKLSAQDAAISELKVQQKSVKDLAEQNSKQVVMFTNLKKLLEVKLKTLTGAGGVMGGPAEGEVGREEYNRLVLS